jgi:murein DD-endopeptidase MepM/ murein hydrolase activator NlpD
MRVESLARLQSFFEDIFPERHIYVRSGGDMRALVLTPGKQAVAAALAAMCALWMGVCTASMLISLFSVGGGDQEASKIRAYYERLIADRQARLNSAITQLSDNSGGIEQLAADVEKRNAALAMMISQAKDAPDLAVAMKPRIDFNGFGAPLQRIRSVRSDQDRLIAEAENYAKSRAERLRIAIRMAGLNPQSYSAAGQGLGGPLIEAKDPRALAAILDVDEDFAARIRDAATDMDDMRALASTAAKLPLSKPTDSGAKSSGFGVRIDPFNGTPAFHPGLDFAGVMGTAIHVTAPGVVSFTGVRSGYGNTIEVDHGGGFKTRYGHLSAISVKVGQHVALGERIGAMGSTGRSTGPHLHYEVWVNGRVENPDRFVKAGDYVQQAG